MEGRTYTVNNRQEGILAESDGLRRLALLVEYDGSDYVGFQLQATDPTIQGELEGALKSFLGANVRIRGASRTDSGAHAVGQVVDFLTDGRYSVETFVGALNYYLPRDIRVIRASEVPPGFNSRRSATSRTYEYRILNRPLPSPLLRRHYHWIREPLQLERMNRAASALLGSHDFRALAPGHPAEKSSVREVYRWELSRGTEHPDTLVVTCEANGFMQRHIRRTNAVLVEIGKGRWPVESMDEILRASPGKPGDQWLKNIPSLPAHGLCLMEVKYRDQLWKADEEHEKN